MLAFILCLGLYGCGGVGGSRDDNNNNNPPNPPAGGGTGEFVVVATSSGYESYAIRSDRSLSFVSRATGGFSQQLTAAGNVVYGVTLSGPQILAFSVASDGTFAAVPGSPFRRLVQPILSMEGHGRCSFKAEILATRP
jgi:hypothetical protein